MLVAPPKFREETSKKAVRLSAVCGKIGACAGATQALFCCDAQFFHGPLICGRSATVCFDGLYVATVVVLRVCRSSRGAPSGIAAFATFDHQNFARMPTAEQVFLCPAVRARACPGLPP